MNKEKEKVTDQQPGTFEDALVALREARAERDEALNEVDFLHDRQIEACSDLRDAEMGARDARDKAEVLDRKLKAISAIHARVYYKVQAGHYSGRVHDKADAMFDALTQIDTELVR